MYFTVCCRISLHSGRRLGATAPRGRWRSSSKECSPLFTVSKEFLAPTGAQEVALSVCPSVHPFYEFFTQFSCNLHETFMQSSCNPYAIFMLSLSKQSLSSLVVMSLRNHIVRAQNTSSYLRIVSSFFVNLGEYMKMNNRNFKLSVTFQFIVKKKKSIFIFFK